MDQVSQLGFAARVPVGTVAHLSGTTSGTLDGLAGALVASPAWASLGDAVVAFRHDPAPVVAVLGSFDAAQSAQLEALAWQLASVAPDLRILDPRDVEDATVRLADQLRSRVGTDQLQRASFRAIPRGGHIVLGTLAYLLDLDARQLEPDHVGDGPVVVVDDCSLSGRRFREWSVAHPTDRPLVLGVLAAASGLRAALETEGGLLACASGIDLRDLAPEQQGDAYPAWLHRWRERCPDELWIGHPEPICFPWNEPDIGVWNPVTEQVEAGWRLVPPSRCLKNRSTGADAAAVVHVEVDQTNPLRPADDVLCADVADGTIVASADTGRAVRLEGVAADVWRAVLDSGSLAGAVDVLADRYEVAREQLTADVERLVSQLSAGGLLVRPATETDEPAPAGHFAVGSSGGPDGRSVPGVTPGRGGPSTS